MKTVKTYTVKEAIEELNGIRMYANIIGKKLVKREDEKLAALVSELASVMLWLTRHVDEFESEIISENLFDTDDGPVKRSELFEVDTLDGENTHPGKKPGWIIAWLNARTETDKNGELTPLAIALNAIVSNGCDCGTDEPGTCLSCVCEKALKDMYKKLYQHR